MDGARLRWKDDAMRFVTALAIGAVLAFSAPARAQDASLLSLMGFGGEEKDEIKYLERPPLVVPKDNVLPAPVDRTADAAAWPKDPDELRAIKRRRDRAKSPEEKNPTQVNLEFIRAQQAKREKKIQAGEVREGGLTCTLFTCVEPDRPRQGAQDDPAAQVLANGEPARRYLTDPPAGLRAPAPAPAPAPN
jgi:hypothetical protein